MSVEEALRPLASGLEHDGYEVAAALDGDVVSVTVTAGPDACAECLVPKELMAQLVAQTLADAGMPVSPERVRLTYPTDVA